MKRVLFSMILAIASVIGALHAYGAYTNDSPTLSDLAKANIEALASIPLKRTCFDTVTFVEGYVTVYCGTCDEVPGRPSTWAGVSECNVE